MSSLHNAVFAAFNNRAWEYRAVAGQEVIEAYFEAHHGKVFLHVQTHAPANVVTVVSNASFTVTKAHLRAAAELLMRTNKELNLGNFELDWDSGQVMYRISNIFSADHHDEKIIASLVHSAIAEMDRLTPFLGELCKLCASDLILLSVPELMARTDLLPVVE